MNKLTQQLIYVSSPDTMNSYIKQGWNIKQISADSNGCWILLEKSVYVPTVS